MSSQVEVYKSLCANPFIHNLNLGVCYYIWLFTFGIWLFVIRFILVFLIILTAALLAKIFKNVLKFCRVQRDTPNFSRWSNCLKKPVFGLFRVAFFVAGFYRIKIVDKSGTDKANHPHVLIVAPHSSFIDVLALIAFDIPSIITRAENAKNFFVGDVLILADCIFVNREAKESRNSAIEAIKNKAANGQIMIFPEGTCSNREFLVEFKAGAFISGLPVLPVAFRYYTGKVDNISWTWEGAGWFTILFLTLTKWSTGCQLTILPPYEPTEQEKENPIIFGENVRLSLCFELGILPSFYSFDDCNFVLFAQEINIFRSPVCLKLLRLCFKIADEDLKKQNANSELSGSSLSQRRNFNDSLKEVFGMIRSPGDWLDVPSLSQPAYITKKYIQFFDIRQVRRPSRKKLRKTHLKRSSKVLIGQQNEQKSEEPLPLSNAVRKPTVQPKLYGSTKKGAEEKNLVYNTFCKIVTRVLDYIENEKLYEDIDSTDDLAAFMDIEEYSEICKSKTIVNLLKTLEYNCEETPTTLHLLLVLHLCDCREPDMWKRIEACMKIMSDFFPKIYYQQRESLIEGPTSITLFQFKILMWYTLGIQQFDEEYFFNQDINFDYLQSNLTKLFKRAVKENAKGLLSKK